MQIHTKTTFFYIKFLILYSFVSSLYLCACFFLKEKLESILFGAVCVHLSMSMSFILFLRKTLLNNNPNDIVVYFLPSLLFDVKLFSIMGLSFTTTFIKHKTTKLKETEKERKIDEDIEWQNWCFGIKHIKQKNSVKYQ